MHMWDGGAVGKAQQGREGDVPVHLQVHQGLPQLRNRYEVVGPNQFCEVGLVNSTQCHVHSAIEKNGGCNKMVCSYWYVLPARLAMLDGIKADLESCWQQLHVLLGLYARLEHPQLLLFLVSARACRDDADDFLPKSLSHFPLNLCIASIEAIDSIPRPRRRPPPASPLLRSSPPRSLSFLRSLLPSLLCLID